MFDAGIKAVSEFTRSTVRLNDFTAKHALSPRVAENSPSSSRRFATETSVASVELIRRTLKSDEPESSVDELSGLLRVATPPNAPIPASNGAKPTIAPTPTAKSGRLRTDCSVM
jgi:hypothetical protein